MVGKKRNPNFDRRMRPDKRFNKFKTYRISFKIGEKLYDHIRFFKNKSEFIRNSIRLGLMRHFNLVSIEAGGNKPYDLDSMTRISVENHDKV